jgi:hypothetical protein
MRLRTKHRCATKIMRDAYAILEGFLYIPGGRPYFFATAQKNRHKLIGNEFEHPQDGPKGEIYGCIS